MVHDCLFVWQVMVRARHQLDDYIIQQKYIEKMKYNGFFHLRLTILNDILNSFLRIKLMWRQFQGNSNLAILDVDCVGLIHEPHEPHLTFQMT